jgi:apolipoprotein N-acyltransferase
VRVPRPPSRRAVAAFGSGAIFAASSPPIDLPVGILVGLALFAWSLDDHQHPGGRVGFRRGWLFGFGANLVALRFVPEVLARFTPLPWVANWTALVLLSAAQALPWAIGAGVARALARRVHELPSFLSFALAVYVATFVPAIFPWTPAGGLATWPALLQLSDVVGERGTSFVVALAWGLVAEAATRFARRKGTDTSFGLAAKQAAAPLLLGLAITGGLAAMGALRMAEIEALRTAAPKARVALVQPGFDASDRWEASRAAMMSDRLTALTKSAEKRGADLVVWPESAYPYSLPATTRRDPGGERAVLREGVHGPVLTGAYMKGDGAGYNSAILVTPDGAIGKPYHKRHLLWFGETVPLADTFPWLARAFARGTGLSPGHEGVVFETNRIRGAVLNCYEDTLPIAGREAMEGRPNLLVNITNDAWFTGSAEGELHLHLSVLRAIEMRRDLVRAVNQGPTSFVDATGRIRARYADPMPATLPVEPALLETEPTLYARAGDAPLLLLVAAAIVVPHARRRRAQKNASSAAPS